MPATAVASAVVCNCARITYRRDRSIATPANPMMTVIKIATRTIVAPRLLVRSVIPDSKGSRSMRDGLEHRSDLDHGGTEQHNEDGWKNERRQRDGHFERRRGRALFRQLFPFSPKRLSINSQNSGYRGSPALALDHVG